jgi:hypothetical protein
MYNGMAEGWRAHRRTGTVLLGTILLVFAGCRENATVLTGSDVAEVPKFSAGDSLLFDAWDLDSFGYPVTSSRKVVIWCVASVTDTVAGATGVTTVIESADGTQNDTLRFQFRTDGTVYQYGYLAKVVLRREHIQRVSQWDLLADAGRGTGSGWFVGMLDSAGMYPVYGTLEGSSYFSAAINGTPMVFSGVTAALEGENFIAEVSFSSNPPTVLRLFEEASSGAQGFLRSLSSARIHR